MTSQAVMRTPDERFANSLYFPFGLLLFRCSNAP
jgi:hypothetical protein